jgi:DNA-binding GntR family transcriptional regulator
VPADAVEAGPLGTSHRELWELVCDEVRALIISGEFAPGERLVEATLAERFAVSRGPVRRALMELQRVGLLTSTRRKGVHVSTLRPEDIDELFDVTRAIEGMAAREASDRASPEQVSGLFQMLDELDRAQRSGDAALAIEADLELHRKLVQASGNRRLLQLWTQIAEEIRFVIAVAQRALPDIEWANYNRPIVEAVARGDTRAAEDAVESCFTRVHARLKAPSSGAFGLYSEQAKERPVDPSSIGPN